MRYDGEFMFFLLDKLCKCRATLLCKNIIGDRMRCTPVDMSHEVITLLS